MACCELRLVIRAKVRAQVRRTFEVRLQKCTSDIQNKSMYLFCKKTALRDVNVLNVSNVNYDYAEWPHSVLEH